MLVKQSTVELKIICKNVQQLKVKGFSNDLQICSLNTHTHWYWWHNTCLNLLKPDKPHSTWFDICIQSLLWNAMRVSHTIKGKYLKRVQLLMWFFQQLKKNCEDHLCSSTRRVIFAFQILFFQFMTHKPIHIRWRCQNKIKSRQSK